MLSRALSTPSTYGNSRIAASTMAKASAGGRGISIWRRCRFAKVVESILSAMRRTRRTWEKARMITMIIVTTTKKPKTPPGVRPKRLCHRMMTRTISAHQARAMRKMKKKDFMPCRIPMGARHDPADPTKPGGEGVKSGKRRAGRERYSGEMPLRKIPCLLMVAACAWPALALAQPVDLSSPEKLVVDATNAFRREAGLGAGEPDPPAGPAGGGLP